MKWMIHAKFGAYRTNRFEVIQFLVNFSFRRRPSWILKNGGFDSSAVWAVSCRLSKLCAKFCDNQTNGSGVIQVFANFNMAAVGHL